MKIIIWLVLFFIISFSMNSIKKTDKYTLLKSFPVENVPPVELYTYDTDLEYINYPVIFKTNKCSFFGNDVKKIKNSNEAREYINSFGYDKEDIIFQEYSPFTNEVGVFVRRNIIDDKLMVYSVVKRDIKEDSLVNNECEKGKCFIVTDKVSETFNKKIIEITERVKGFNWGRYDIKYDSFDELNKGNFHIMELNVGPSLYPAIHPMNFDLAVLWSENDLRSIPLLIEIILFYYLRCFKNIVTRDISLNDIIRNIDKWFNNILCIYN